ncbi:MAG: hypothetical protein Q9157_003905, partial [Trypethelium eluteriae]
MVKAMPNVAGLAPGASMNGQQNPDLTEFYGRNQMPQTMGGPPGHSSGNHALQDYQMQLMLLEQQNKKRLLMARQEQDNSQSIAHGPGPGGPGQGMQQSFPQGVSPQARPGPSPNPNDQVKRGTEKMGQSPLPDGSMPQQGSPAANFDPSQMPQGMPQHYFNHLKAQQESMQMAPNGQMLRPPSSNPNFAAAQASPEQLQQMQLQARQRQANMQNGIGFPGGGPPNMIPQPQPGQPGQQGPNIGTPQQRSMGPPPAPPAGGEANRAQPSQPSSPAQSTNAPPTPSQTNKANPKKKNAAKENKKAASKKGSAAAGTTPATESQEPPTPTPPTPITPMHGNSFNPQQQKNGAGPQPPPNANASQPPASAPAPQPPPIDANAGAPFGDMGNPDLTNLNLDFAPLGESDVLDSFDFDSFLQQPESADGPMFNLDPSSFTFPGPDTLEAGSV